MSSSEMCWGRGVVVKDHATPDVPGRGEAGVVHVVAVVARGRPRAGEGADTVTARLVVPGVRAYSPTLISGPITTFQSGTVTAGVSTSAVTVTGRGNGTNASRVTTPDISATNGVIHKIDRVLLP